MEAPEPKRQRTISNQLTASTRDSAQNQQIAAIAPIRLSNLGPFPEELWDNVLSFLPKKDLKQARLASLRLGNIGTSWLFTKLNVRLSRKSLQSFSKVYNSIQLSRFVLQLNWCIDIECWTRESTTHDMTEIMRQALADGLIYSLTQTPSGRNFPTFRYTMEESINEENRERTRGEQLELIENQAIVPHLEAAARNLKKLQYLRLYSNIHQTTRRSFDRLSHQCSLECRQPRYPFPNLIISKLQRPIKTLDLMCANWMDLRIFDEHSTNMLSSLQSLQLATPWFLNQVTHVPSATPVLQSLIRATQSLKELIVDHLPVGIIPWRELEHFRWTQLEKVSIRYSESALSNTVEFLVQHAASLRTLELDGVWLQRTTLLDFFKDLSQALSLTEFQIHGMLGYRSPWIFGRTDRDPIVANEKVKLHYIATPERRNLYLAAPTHKVLRFLMCGKVALDSVEKRSPNPRAEDKPTWHTAPGWGYWHFMSWDRAALALEGRPGGPLVATGPYESFAVPLPIEP